MYSVKHKHPLNLNRFMILCGNHSLALLARLAAHRSKEMMFMIAKIAFRLHGQPIGLARTTGEIASCFYEPFGVLCKIDIKWRGGTKIFILF